MMFKVQDQHLRIATLVVHSLLIFVGLTVVGIGLVLHEGIHSQINPDNDTGNTISETSITVGCLDIVIGVCGLTAALMKQRALQIVNATLLAFAILINLIFLIACIHYVAIENRLSSFIQGNKEMFAKYGNLSDPESREFTFRYDNYQDLNSCCGWTGLDGDNVYLNSPWHKMANQNVTGKPITLPESCCVRPDDVECTTAENVKEAREKGLVYKKECLSTILGSKNAPYNGIIIQTALSLLLQIPSAALTVMFLLRAP